ncbi:hypothetical protein BGX30_014867 [Mortierella sp. GBA39]|nr:hypothetical protein BGX30_014867 [Mortierella sp. GBA39]
MKESGYFRTILVVSDIIKESGWASIVYLAAIAGVDPSLYEAAKMDGAKKWQQIRHITLPGIQSTIIVLFILQLGNILELGVQQVFMLYNPLVYNVGDIIDTYVYRVGLTQQKYSFATAVGLFQSTVGLVLIYAANFVTKRMAYRLLLKDDDFYRAFGVSVLRTAAGVAINMTLTSLMAYPLSRVHLKGRNLVMNMVIFTLLFQGGLIPSFLLLRELHLLDSIWSLLLPSAVSPFNLILLKNFFQSVPHSLEESAKIDGAGHGTILFRIMIPLSMPAIATLSLFYAVMHWNTYFDAVMYISNPAWNPLQVYLRNMIVLSESNIDMTNNTGLFLIAPDTLKAATIVASVLPMIIVYPFVQRFFTKGVMLGALKE